MPLISHWFSFADGNTALVAGGIVFLVHRSVVERQSQILGTAIKALAGVDRVKGCPALRLDDNPNDLAHFVTAIYDGVAHIKCDSSDFDAAAAVLRLATKYGADRIREGVLHRFKKAWPNTLAKWDYRESLVVTPDGITAPQLICPHPILIINLAREINAPELLPSAFYDLARTSITQISGGYFHPNSGTHALSAPDLVDILKGKQFAADFLVNFSAGTMQGRPQPPTCLCLQAYDSDLAGGCQSVFIKTGFDIAVDLNRTELVDYRHADPLYAIACVKEKLAGIGVDVLSNSTPPKACEDCRLAFAPIADAARQECWSLLPSWFGVKVPKWPG